MPDTIIIFNPAAKGEKAKRFLDTIQELSPKAELRPTASEHDAEEFARQAVREGVRTIVAAGGDGTVNQVVNGIGESGVRLGILPVGTMNVFAAELGIPNNDLPGAWALMRSGRIREIDLPIAGNHYFAQLAGIGLDAQVVQETDLDFRKNFGPLSYLVSATQIAARKPPKLLVRLDDGQEHTGSFVLVGNGRYYGGPFTIFSRADTGDGLLDILVFKNLSHLDIVRYLQGIVMGSHTRMPDIEYLQASSFSVRSEENVPVEVDGEVVGSLPMDFRIAPEKLRVITPK